LISLFGCEARHSKKEWKGKPFKCRAGQFITSLDGIRRRCGKGVTSRNIRTSLKRFANLGFLTNESTNQNRLITLCNWETYEHAEYESDKATDKQLNTPSTKVTSELTNELTNQNRPITLCNCETYEHAEYESDKATDKRTDRRLTNDRHFVGIAQEKEKESNKERERETKEKEKESNKERERETNTSVGSKFPFELKSGEHWSLPQAKLDEYRQTYPTLDVEAELRKAGQWLKDNPQRRKTARGMPRFLGQWLSRAKPEDRGQTGTREFTESEVDELFASAGVV